MPQQSAKLMDSRFARMTGWGGGDPFMLQQSAKLMDSRFARMTVGVLDAIYAVARCQVPGFPLSRE
jgi:hypothetical protein